MWRRNPMHYTSQYPSPLGELLLAADDAGLTGVWFVGQKYFARSLAPNSVAREIPLFAQVKQWLALYFAGQEPELEIPIHMVGTAFQKAVEGFHAALKLARADAQEGDAGVASPTI